VSGAPAVRSQRWLAAFFVVLTLAGCSQATTSRAGDPSPSSPETGGIRPEHGGGNLPGGAGM
jgi:hypothetical protein